MSDHIPLEIQSEVIKRLPVKSVIQCRSVSKLWKSLIDSSEFIKSYHIICKTRPQHHLLVRYELANELKYVSIMDDDTFPNQKSFLTVPQPVSLLGNILSLKSVNGLLCFYASRRDAVDQKIVVLWNPSVVKAVAIPIYNSNKLTFVGFGVCPNTSDFKLVRINTNGYLTVNWEVEVFMLSTRVWKNVCNISLAFKTCDLTYCQYFVDGFIYWRAYDNITLAPGIRSNLIISFDLKSHEFGLVCLPDCLVHTDVLMASNLYESLSLFEYYNDGDIWFCDVWIMKKSVTKAFTKMLSIKALDSWVVYSVCGIRKNGEVIIENSDDANSYKLEVYEPSSGRISGIGINGTQLLLDVNSYMETLLLLDESNSIIH
ncbi:F-box domain containing protein [Tanacetum coccineum]